MERGVDVGETRRAPRSQERRQQRQHQSGSSAEVLRKADGYLDLTIDPTPQVGDSGSLRSIMWIFLLHA